MLPRREEYSIDFHLSDDVGYAVAIRRTVVDLYLDICHRAGFRPLIIDIPPFALSNTYQSLLKEKRHEVLTLLSLEEEITTFVMLQNGNLLCTSIIPTDQLENRRDTEGIVDDGTEMRETWRSDSLVSYLRHLLSETNYARRGPSFDRILLCGEMIDSKKHLSALASESQTPPQIIAPFDLLKIGRIAQERDDLLMQGHLFIVALGLAYRGLEEL
jgi:Tfp pilus assembly PilM family ATPase